MTINATREELQEYARGAQMDADKELRQIAYDAGFSSVNDMRKWEDQRADERRTFKQR